MKDLPLLLLAAVLLYPAFALAALSPDDHVRVYVGTYTRGESRGIYLFDLDLRSGELTSLGLVAETTNPSFLAIHPSGDLLFAVNEVSEMDGRESGGVSAFRIDSADGELSFVNKVPSAGTGPCYLIVDKSGKNVLVANYGSGSVASFPIGADGHLEEASSVDQHVGSSVNPHRQEGPHAHSIVPDPSNRFVLSADLGLDKILVYRYDPEDGVLTPDYSAGATVEPGSGPRHIAIGPDGRFVYVLNEMALTVTGFAYDSTDGSLTSIQTISTLPGDAEPWYSAAEIRVHPSGEFLYASNRGHNSIAAFAIDSTSGKLTPIEYQGTQGKTPRNFGIDPSGRYLLAANEDSNTLVVFRINQMTGALSPTGKAASVPAPTCVKFLK